MASDCIFCRIIAGEIPSQMVYEDERVVAFRDIAPRARVHVLVVPHEHIGSMAEVEPGRETLLGACLLAAARVARQEGIAASGFRLVLNSGPDSGMEVAHLHVHVLGGQPLGRMG